MYIMNNNLVFKNELQKHVLYHSIIQTLTNRLTSEIPKFNDLRLNNELTLLLCNLVENTIKKSDKQVNKKSLVIDVLKNIHNLTEEEIKQVEDDIQFMYDHNRIKKLKFFREWLPQVLSAWVTKKLL